MTYYSAAFIRTKKHIPGDVTNREWTIWWVGRDLIQLMLDNPLGMAIGAYDSTYPTLLIPAMPVGWYLLDDPCLTNSFIADGNVPDDGLSPAFRTIEVYEPSLTSIGTPWIQKWHDGFQGLGT